MAVVHEDSCKVCLISVWCIACGAVLQQVVSSVPSKGLRSIYPAPTYKSRRLVTRRLASIVPIVCPPILFHFYPINCLPTGRGLPAGTSPYIQRLI